MPRTLTVLRCPHGGNSIAVEDRGQGGSKRILGASGHACRWSEVWRYGFLPAEFAAKILEFEDRAELPVGALVQVIGPAADGSTGMVGMIGIVVPPRDGEPVEDEMPDKGGVRCYFHWPDSGLRGHIARARLRVVGMTTFVPGDTWIGGGVVTVDAGSIVVKEGA